MKVVLSRDEIKQIVGERFGITDFILEISSENANKPTKEVITRVDSNNFVLSLNSDNNSNHTIFKNTPGQVSDRSKNSSTSPVESEVIQMKKRGKSSKRSLPAHPRVDYEHYGIIMEKFLHSVGKTASVDLEGLSISTIEHRYRTAAELFGYSSKVQFIKDAEHKELQMSKKE